MKIIVMEVQKFKNGQMSTPTYAYDVPEGETMSPQAEAKYHSILAGAAVSALPVHSCVMITEEGAFIDSKCYKHKAQAATVES